jgi:hypothetical protein
MNDRTSKLIGAAIAVGLLLNGIVGLVNLTQGTPAQAQGLQRVIVCSDGGVPLSVSTSIRGRPVLDVHTEK